MTLRDLTPRQLYNLRRRCEKERKQWMAKRYWGFNKIQPTELEVLIWKDAYNYGLKAGLLYA